MMIKNKLTYKGRQEVWPKTIIEHGPKSTQNWDGIAEQ